MQLILLTFIILGLSPSFAQPCDPDSFSHFVNNLIFPLDRVNVTDNQQHRWILLLEGGFSVVLQSQPSIDYKSASFASRLYDSWTGILYPFTATGIPSDFSLRISPDLYWATMQDVVMNGTQN